MAEKIQFDILANDRASGGFRAAGRAAAAASDDVLGLARRLDDVGKKQARARVELAGDKEALSRLDRLDARMLTTGRRVVSPNIDVHGAARASADISAVDIELDKLIAKSAEAEAAVGSSSGGLSGVSGMGALIGAGVALSPVLVTLGTGLAGFGAAAYGSLSPIAKAAQATGGLQKNLSKLDPDQQAAARSALHLAANYQDFQRKLEPAVLGDFNKGLRLASNLMGDVAPVAAATGKAVGGLLDGVDAEFQSGTWQKFFGFMAQTAGPDMALLSANFTDLLDTLPPLLEDLQPLATGFLKTTDGVVKLTGAVARVSGEEEKLAQNSGTTSGALGILERAAGRALGQLEPGIPASRKLADAFQSTGKAAAGPAFSGLVKMSTQLETTDERVGTLTGDLSKLDSLLSDQSAEIAWKQAQQAATTAIKGGSAALDGNSKAALANRAKVVSSTQSLLGLIQNEQKGGTSLSKMSGQLQNQIKWLQSSGDKSNWLKGEVRDLEKAWDALHSKKVAITVTGDGSFAVVQGGHRIITGPRQAAGSLVTGGIPGVDSVPLLAQRNELVVPVPIVKSGAVDHLSGMIPGWHGASRMAAGGVVGSIHTGSPSKLGPWITGDYNATVRLIEQATAKATARLMNSFTGTGTGGSGVTRWAPVILNALGMLGQSAGNLGAVEHRMAQESGGNPTIVNRTDSNWLAGTPSVGLMQVIGPTFASNAGPFRSVGPFEYGTSVNPLANTYAGLHHALTAYPGRSLSSVMLQPGGYDHGGYLPPGLSLAYNGTGQPERIPDPTKPAPRSGPLINIENYNPREAADVSILAQQLSFRITASGLG